MKIFGNLLCFLPLVWVIEVHAQQKEISKMILNVRLEDFGKP